MSFKHSAAFFVTGALWRSYQALPLALSMRIARASARLAALGFSKERAIAKAQLELAARSDKEGKSELARRLREPNGAANLFRDSLEHVFLSVAELAHLQELLTTDNSIPPPFNYRNISDTETGLAAAYRKEARGTLALSGHIGNFELLAAYLSRADVPLTVIGRAPNYPSLSTFVDNLRRGYGVEGLWRSGRAAASGLLRALKQGRALAVLIDQDTALDNAFGPFFGVPAAHPAAPIQIAIKHRLRIITAFIVRVGPSKHRVVSDSIEVDYDAPNAAEHVLRVYGERLQQLVLDYPEQWLWWHRRWRRRPGVDYEKTPEALRKTADYLKWLQDGAKDN